MLFYNNLQNWTKTALVNSFGEYRGLENRFRVKHQNRTQQPVGYNLWKQQENSGSATSGERVLGG